VEQYEVTERVYVTPEKGYRVIAVPILAHVHDGWSAGLEQSTRERSYFDTELLTQGLSWLDEMLQHTNALFDPELQSCLVDFRRALRGARLSLQNIDWSDEESRTEFLESIQTTVFRTLQVREKLQNMLDQDFKIADDSLFSEF
jgi:hypothetical protein